MKRLACAAGLALAAALTSLCANAQSVNLAGRMGDRALLVIDGKPHTLPVGGSVGSVKLLRWAGDDAELDLGGKRATLRVGGSPAQLGAAGSGSAAGFAGGGREIIMPVGEGGHFIASGSINGKTVRFMVDTGATLIAMGRDEAERLGIDLSTARIGTTQTANGAVQVLVVTLPKVRVGNVEVANVGAVVMPQPMPHLLLGNSFLNRFQMQRDSDTMRLTLR
jgi:aspartyl protease family protein